MAYENQMDLNWGVIDAFPLPEWGNIEENSDKIHEMAEELWHGMRNRFDPDAGLKGEIQGVSELKDLVDEIDELLGPMYGLSEEEIQYLKNYDAEYGRGKEDLSQESLT
jgi:hypothetical protein